MATSCSNCYKEVLLKHPIVKCGSCTNYIHLECLDLPKNVVFFVLNLNSPHVKFHCEACSKKSSEEDTAVDNVFVELSQLIEETKYTVVSALDRLKGFSEKFIAQSVKVVDSKNEETEDEEESVDNVEGTVDDGSALAYKLGFSINLGDYTLEKEFKMIALEACKSNNEYSQYYQKFQQTDGCINYNKTKEIVQNIFAISKDYSLAHFVSEDMNMDNGIAVQFRRDFKRIDELLNQRQSSGGLAVLDDEERFIYYLVTKKYSTCKTTYKSLFSSLQELRKHTIKNDVRKVAIPQTGNYLDRLIWKKLKSMIEFIFRDVDVEIVICNLQQSDYSLKMRHWNCKVVNVTYPIHKMEEGSIIVYFSSEDKYISKEMELLDKKFNFLSHFKSQNGDLKVFDKNENYLLAGCIVKKTKADKIDFKALQKCFSNIQRLNKKYEFSSIAFQAIEDEDTCINYKIINILRNTMRDVEVYICWPGDLKTLMSPNDTFSSPITTDFDKNDEQKSSTVENKNHYPTQSSNCKPSSNYNEKSSEISLEIKNDNAHTEKIFQTENPEQIPTKDKISENKTVLEQERNNIYNFEELYNPEYELYLKERENGNINFAVVQIRQASNLPAKYSQVCYITEDMCVDRGNSFRNKDRRCISCIMNQQIKEGNCTYLYRNPDYLYCVILKKLLTSTYHPFRVFEALQHLRMYVTETGVKKLVVPNLKSDPRDLFDSNEIKNMYEFLFCNRNIQIIMMDFTDVPYFEIIKNKNRNQLFHVKHPLHHMKRKSIILFWAAEDGTISEEMHMLLRKYNFMEDYCRATRQLGKVFHYRQDEDYVLYGCTVKETQDGEIDFLKLHDCISAVNERNKRDKLPNVAVQAVKDEDEVVNHKIIHILLNNLENVNIKYCWPGNLKAKMPSENP